VAARLQDKVAILTGAASGIGEAVARRYLDEGARCVLVDVKPADSFGDALAAAYGDRVLTVSADVTRREDIERTLASTLERFGRVDILFNNAALFDMRPLLDESWDVFDRLFAVNVKGMFFLMQTVARKMVEQGHGGKIINMSSIWGIGAGPNCPAYCAAKGGVVNLTRALAVEIGRENMNVNSLAPGNIATPLNAHLRGPDMADYIAHMRALTPTGRDFLQPEELTGTAVYLASSDSDAVHGVTIAVDAGWGAW